MRTLFTFVVIMTISLSATAQTRICCQDQVVTIKEEQAGDQKFTIKTSHYSNGYSGTTVELFDRVFYMDANGREKELPLPGYMRGHARKVLSIKLNNSELVVEYADTEEEDYSSRVTFVLHQGSWKRLTS